jgi:hypothetical protein
VTPGEPHRAAYLDPAFLRWDDAETEMAAADPVLKELAERYGCAFLVEVRHPGRKLERRSGLTRLQVALTMEVPAGRDDPHRYSLGEGAYRWLRLPFVASPGSYRQVGIYEADELGDSARLRRDVEEILARWPG